MIPARCRALWEPATLPVSSFTHSSPVVMPMLSASVLAGLNGVTRKPRPSTRATASSSSRTSCTNASSLIPQSFATRVRREQLAVEHERVRIAFAAEPGTLLSLTGRTT